MLEDYLFGIGFRTLAMLETVGNASTAIFHAIVGKPNFRQGTERLIAQIYSVGVLSLVIMIVSGFFIGMVLGLQGYTILSKFGAEQALGQLIALSMVRELGPVIGALLFAGLMKVTEQLSSMEMMGVDPLRRIIAPRFWAGQISLPILTIIFNAVAILGGFLVGVDWLGVDAGAFWSNMQNAVEFNEDVWNGIIKSFVFGAVVTWIAVFQGLDSIPTSEGIGRATTKTVVYSSLCILGLDFFLTAVMFRGF